jgi:spore germination protein GerM
MPKKRKKSKLAPILWIVLGLLLAFYFFYNKFDFKKYLSKFSSNQKENKSFSLPSILSSKSSESSFSSEAKTSYIKVVLYLGVMGEKYVSLVPVEKEILKSNTPLKDTLENLIAFRDEKYLNLIPINTKIRNIWIKDNFAHIDFSDEFNYNSYGVSGYNIQIYQVVYTACQFKNIKGVYFYVEGKPLKYLGGEGFIIQNPVKPYTSLPKFSF